MVLVRFDDVIGQPSNFSVEWAGTLDEAGIIGSLTTGGTYDAAYAAHPNGTRPASPPPATH